MYCKLYQVKKKNIFEKKEESVVVIEEDKKKYNTDVLLFVYSKEGT